MKTSTSTRDRSFGAAPSQPATPEEAYGDHPTKFPRLIIAGVVAFVVGVLMVVAADPAEGFGWLVFGGTAANIGGMLLIAGVAAGSVVQSVEHMLKRR